MHESTLNGNSAEPDASSARVAAWRKDPSGTVSPEVARAAAGGGPFTTYVRRLDSSGTPPSQEALSALLDDLRKALIYEMKRRGLWSLPPIYLGIPGGLNWTEEPLEELLLDCYTFIFVLRLEGLRKQLLVRSDLDGLIFLNIRHFLFESQRCHDPIGYRVYQVAHDAIERLCEDGTLHVLGGDPRLRNDTVLGFAPWLDPVLAQGLDLSFQVAVWNDDLLPDLVCAHHKAKTIGKLAEHIASLPTAGIEVFLFQELLEPMKKDVRDRWHALQSPTKEEVGVEQDSGEPCLKALVPSSSEAEEREGFAALSACVEERLARHHAARRKTLDYLERLWVFLRGWAASDSLANEDVPDIHAGTEERLPSDNRLEKMLKIPRARFPDLKTTLGEMINACREGSKVPIPGGHRMAATTLVQPAGRREHLRLATGAAAARLAELPKANVGEIRPGVTCVYERARAFAGELLVVEQAANALRVLVVPIDDHPLFGRCDVVLADGVRRARCDAAVWIDAPLLQGAARTGEVEERILREIRQQRLSTESWQASATDGGVEDRAWRGLIERAVGGLGRAESAARTLPRSEADGDPSSPSSHPRAVPTSLRFPRRWREARQGLLAAALALLMVGMGSWVVVLKNDLAASREISTVAPGFGVVLGDVQRGSGGDDIRLGTSSTHGVLHVVDMEGATGGRRRVEILTSDGRLLGWTEIAPGEEEGVLYIPRAELTESQYRLRMIAADGREMVSMTVGLEVVEDSP